MPDTTNLLEGISRIFVGAANSDVLPVDTVDFGGAWGGTWRDLGYTTEDGVSIQLNQSNTPVMSAQSRTPVHYIMGQADDIISCTLTEATILNIKLVTGRGTIQETAPSGPTEGFRQLTLSDASTIAYVAIGFEGLAPPNTVGNPRRIYFPKVLSTGQVTYNQRVGAVVGIGAQFSRVGGTGNDGVIRDVLTS